MENPWYSLFSWVHFPCTYTCQVRYSPPRTVEIRKMSQLKYTHANPTDPWDRKLPDHHYPEPEDSKCHGSSTSTRPWQCCASTKKKIQLTINPATGPEKNYRCYQAGKPLALQPAHPIWSPHQISTQGWDSRETFPVLSRAHSQNETLRTIHYRIKSPPSAEDWDSSI